jgi:hypothetical protein
MAYCSDSLPKIDSMRGKPKNDVLPRGISSRSAALVLVSTSLKSIKTKITLSINTNQGMTIGSNRFEENVILGACSKTVAGNDTYMIIVFKICDVFLGSFVNRKI